MTLKSFFANILYMKYYELAYIITPELTEEEIKNLQEKVKSFISKEQGNITFEASLKRIRLGYSINRKTEAFLISLDFSLEQGVENIDKSVKLEKQILRNLIVQKQSPEKLMQRKAIRRPRIQEPMKRSPELQKIELKELDRKIEEILKE